MNSLMLRSSHLRLHLLGLRSPKHVLDEIEAKHIRDLYVSAASLLGDRSMLPAPGLSGNPS
jgi:hypothetical protein